jgi:hypothetical protein
LAEHSFKQRYCSCALACIAGFLLMLHVPCTAARLIAGCCCCCVCCLQVKECLKLAVRGKEYIPPKGAAASKDGGDAAQAAAATTKGDSDSDGDSRGEQGSLATGEAGQRQEQQLHEALGEQQAAEGEDAARGGGVGGGGDDIGQAGSDALLEEGLLETRAGLATGSGSGGGQRGGVVKRIGDGTDAGGGALGAARLALLGVLLWAGSLVLACFVLPWARRVARRAAWRSNGGGGGGQYKAKGGRDD